MRTAIDILKEATEKVSKNLGMDITFQHGRHETVVNYIMNLQRVNDKVYPAVIVFTEGMIEKQDTYWVEFTIPKVAICTLTIENATEKQRLESNFKTIIYPIFESLQKELEKLHYGYDFVLTRTDIPYFTDINRNLQASNQHVFNQLVDGCAIKNLKMKVMYEPCELKVRKVKSL